MFTDTQQITQAKVKQETASTDTQTSVPSTPNIEELQSRILEKDRLIADLHAQVKGRTKENVKLQQLVNDRAALKQELKDEVATVVREHISALGDVLFADDETETQAPPSKKQMLKERLKPPEKKAPVPSEESNKAYEEGLKYSGRVDALLEDTGVKMDELPEELVDDAKSKWTAGDVKGAYKDLKQGINDYLKTKNEKAQQKEAEAKKEKEKTASLVTIDKVQSSGVPSSNSIEGLRTKLRTNQPLTSDELQKLDADNTRIIKEMEKKGSM